MFGRSSRILKTSCSLQTKEGCISFLFKRSSKRKTIAIVVDEKAEVSVAAPFYISKRDVHAFVRQKSEWISRKVEDAERNKRRVNKKKFEHGEIFQFLGKRYKLEACEADIKRGKIEFDGIKWSIFIPANLTIKESRLFVRDKLFGWYRSQAEEILGGRIFHYSRIIGVEPRKIAVKAQKRLWGNCNYNLETIHLNWQIILFPLEIVDYVVVHELCHLIVPNHSSRFWKKVEKFLPDFKQRRKWLKANSPDIQFVGGVAAC